MKVVCENFFFFFFFSRGMHYDRVVCRRVVIQDGKRMIYMYIIRGEFFSSKSL